MRYRGDVFRGKAGNCLFLAVAPCVLFTLFRDADPVIITDRAADIFFASLAAVPLGLARPVYLASFAAIDLVTIHTDTIQYFNKIVNI